MLWQKWEKGYFVLLQKMKVLMKWGFRARLTLETPTALRGKFSLTQALQFWGGDPNACVTARERLLQWNITVLRGEVSPVYYSWRENCPGSLEPRNATRSHQTSLKRLGEIQEGAASVPRRSSRELVRSQVYTEFLGEDVFQDENWWDFKPNSKTGESLSSGFGRFEGWGTGRFW